MKEFTGPKVAANWATMQSLRQASHRKINDRIIEIIFYVNYYFGWVTTDFENILSLVIRSLKIQSQADCNKHVNAFLHFYKIKNEKIMPIRDSISFVSYTDFVSAFNES